MSHGLGRMQRLLLVQMANTEMQLAEQAVKHQKAYYPPTMTMLMDVFRDIEELVKTIPFHVGRFHPASDFHEFNPTRTMKSLIKRGLVAKNPDRRLDSLTLTREGFLEALRLGGVKKSSVVDPEQLLTRWGTGSSRHYYGYE